MNIDPRAEEYNFQSAYAFANNNPILFIDINGEGVDNEYDVNTKTGKVTKVSNLGGEEINYYHYSGGGSENYDGKTRILNTDSGDDQMMKSSKWMKGYTHRSAETNLGDIVDEYYKGTGPEKSLVGGSEHQINKDIIDSPIFKSSKEKFIERGIDKKTLVTNEGEFGLIGAGKAGTNTTAQMLGKFNVSFYPVGNKVVVFGVDSKSGNSGNPVKKVGAWLSGNPEKYNIPRVNGKGGPSSTTHQTYIFHLPISIFK